LDIKYILLRHFGIKPWELCYLKLSEVIYFIDKLNEDLSMKKKVPDWQEDMDLFLKNKRKVNHA